MDINDEAKQTVLQAKYARIIEEYSSMYNVSLERAMDLLYNSKTLELIQNGVADLHCRSDKYLAEELHIEQEQLTTNIAAEKAAGYNIGR